MSSATPDGSPDRSSRDIMGGAEERPPGDELLGLGRSDPNSEKGRNLKSRKGLGQNPNPFPCNKKAVPTFGRRLIKVVLASE